MRASQPLSDSTEFMLVEECDIMESGDDTVILLAELNLHIKKLNQLAQAAPHRKKFADYIAGLIAGYERLNLVSLYTSRVIENIPARVDISSELGWVAELNKDLTDLSREATPFHRLIAMDVDQLLDVAVTLQALIHFVQNALVTYPHHTVLELKLKELKNIRYEIVEAMKKYIELIRQDNQFARQGLLHSFFENIIITLKHIDFKPLQKAPDDISQQLLCGQINMEMLKDNFECSHQNEKKNKNSIHSIIEHILKILQKTSGSKDCVSDTACSKVPQQVIEDMFLKYIENHEKDVDIPEQLSPSTDQGWSAYLWDLSYSLIAPAVTTYQCRIDPVTFYTELYFSEQEHQSLFRKELILQQGNDPYLSMEQCEIAFKLMVHNLIPAQAELIFKPGEMDLKRLFISCAMRLVDDFFKTTYSSSPKFEEAVIIAAQYEARLENYINTHLNFYSDIMDEKEKTKIVAMAKEHIERDQDWIRNSNNWAETIDSAIAQRQYELNQNRLESIGMTTSALSAYSGYVTGGSGGVFTPLTEKDKEEIESWVLIQKPDSGLRPGGV